MFKIPTSLQSCVIDFPPDYFQKWKGNQSKISLLFDGASKGDPREVGVGGLIFDHGGKNIHSFAWGFGKKKNNQTEWKTLM